MKASKFTDAQKAFILKQGSDGMPVADVCRSRGSSLTRMSGAWNFQSKKRGRAMKNNWQIKTHTRKVKTKDGATKTVVVKGSMPKRDLVTVKKINKF
jgi:putative transposase